MISLPVSSDFSWHLLSLVDSLLGAAAGACFIYGAGAIYLRARGVEGMGFGDVKLMAMVGACLWPEVDDLHAVRRFDRGIRF